MAAFYSTNASRGRCRSDEPIWLILYFFLLFQIDRDASSGRIISASFLNSKLRRKAVNEIPQLCLDQLGVIGDGAGQLIIDAALNQAVHDTEDRGKDGKSRKVQINVNIKQLASGDVAVDIEAFVKLPNFRTSPTLGRVKIDREKRRKVLELRTEPIEDESEVK